MLHSPDDTVLGYLIEGNAVLRRKVKPEQSRKVPRYRLSLTVGVGRKIDLLAFRCLFFERGDKLLLVGKRDILRLEAVSDIDAEA